VQVSAPVLCVACLCTSGGHFITAHYAKDRFAPEAAVPGITQTDLVARPRQVNTPNFSSSRALAALDLMIYQLNYVGPKISRVGNDRLLKRIRRRHWVFGAVVRPRFGLLGVG